MSGFSIGGIASGLDTAAIVKQLMALERQPLHVMTNRRAAWQAADTAWGQINTKLSSVRSAVDALKDPAALAKAVTASSSNDGIATVRVTGSPSVGATSVTVDALAAAHRTSVGGSFASATELVGEGTLTVRGADGVTALGSVTFTENTTLEDAARQLDAVAGVRAQVVDTGTDGYRIVMTAEGTGAAAAFSVEAPAGHRFETAQVLTQGSDAQLSMGGLSITRPTNIISDLYEGMELRLTGVGEVNLNVERDVDASAKLVKDLVDAVNGALSELAKHGNTSATAGERGVLAGDSLVRSLSTELRGVVAGLSVGGEFDTPSSIGVSLTREGRLTLDETKLRAAITKDPDAVAALVGRASSATDPGVAITATGRATAGTYRLELDVAATVAQVTGAVYTPPTGDPKTFTITTASGKVVSITLTTSETDAAAAVSRINQALRAAGDESVTASVEDGAIKLTASRAGPAGNFSVEGSEDLGLDVVTPGQSAAGRLIDADGVEHVLTGSGRTLTGPTGSPVAGLVLTVPLGTTGPTGEVTVADGLAGAFDRILRTTEGTTGRIATARKNVQSRIQSANDQLAAAERRFELREITIRRQFTAMETALATLQSQGNWLAGQIGSLAGGQY
ncbi:flagellar filament capping protein FliD [Nitriliruptor alkaliphilus]|uniref:flagellar filament capping protein FliD n=1 Tax=Nitriliruptor alkaliphilus TaxID=427918 RepID=UPI000698E6BA|nr:flagellar filament capping protein FliD [Nitriliruptor alkaliphilus]